MKEKNILLYWGSVLNACIHTVDFTIEREKWTYPKYFNQVMFKEAVRSLYILTSPKDEVLSNIQVVLSPSLVLEGYPNEFFADVDRLIRSLFSLENKPLVAMVLRESISYSKKGKGPKLAIPIYKALFHIFEEIMFSSAKKEKEVRKELSKSRSITAFITFRLPLMQTLLALENRGTRSRRHPHLHRN